MRAACIGAHKRRDWLLEVAMFAAWHVVFFRNQLDGGKLKPWAYYRDKARGTPAVVVPQDWKTRKAERQAQMARLKKHQAHRTRPAVKHGR